MGIMARCLSLLLLFTGRLSGADSLKVIGSGYGRTGTETLKTALEILGIKTYHMKATQERSFSLKVCP